jgi:hypothetical protein
VSDLKPEDFFVGVTDFFSILLPGAAIAFIGLFVIDQVGSSIPSDHVLRSLINLRGTAAWVAFGVASYVLGHVVASLGARLDDLYDERKDFHRNHALSVDANQRLTKFLESVPAATAARKANQDRFWFGRVVGWMLLPNAWGRRGEPSELPPQPPINAYKLARIMLSNEAPAIYSEVTRLEADSKFFRSLVVVATFAVIACIVQTGFDVAALFNTGSSTRLVWGLVYLLVVITVLQIAFARFCGLRLKSTEAAFQGMLALNLPSDPARVPSAKPVVP